MDNLSHREGSRACQLPDYEAQPGMRRTGVHPTYAKSLCSPHPTIPGGPDWSSYGFLPGHESRLGRGWPTPNNYGTLGDMVSQSFGGGTNLPVQDSPTLSDTAWSSLDHLVLPHISPVAPFSLPEGIPLRRQLVSGRARMDRPLLGNIFNQAALSSAPVPILAQTLPYYRMDEEAPDDYKALSNPWLQANFRSPILSHGKQNNANHESSQLYDLCAITNSHSSSSSKISNSASVPTSVNYSHNYIQCEWQRADSDSSFQGGEQPNTEALIHQGFSQSPDTPWLMNTNLSPTLYGPLDSSDGGIDQDVSRLSSNTRTLSFGPVPVDEDQTHSRGILNIPSFDSAQSLYQSQSTITCPEPQMKGNSSFRAARTRRSVVQSPYRFQLRNNNCRPSTQGEPVDLTSHNGEVDTKIPDTSHSTGEDEEKTEPDIDARLRRALLEYLHSDITRASSNCLVQNLNTGDSIELSSIELPLGSHLANYQTSNVGPLYQSNLEGKSIFDQTTIEATSTEISPRLEAVSDSAESTLRPDTSDWPGNINNPYESGSKDLDSPWEMPENQESLQINLKISDRAITASCNDMCSVQERIDSLSRFGLHPTNRPNQQTAPTPPLSSFGVISSKDVYDLGVPTPNFSDPHFTIKISKIMKVDTVWYFELSYAKEGDLTARDVEISRNGQYKTYRRIGAAIMHRKSSEGVLYWRSDRAEVLHYNAR